MHKYLKKLWSEENNGGEPSEDQVQAVLYNMKHLAVGTVPVDLEDPEDEDADYQPTELEQEKAQEDEDYTAEKKDVGFDFYNNVEVTEEQFEAAVGKFTEQ